MKLVTTEPAVNEKYDAEVLRACGQPLTRGAGRGVCAQVTQAWLPFRPQPEV